MDPAHIPTFRVMITLIGEMIRFHSFSKHVESSFKAELTGNAAQLRSEEMFGVKPPLPPEVVMQADHLGELEEHESSRPNPMSPIPSELSSRSLPIRCSQDEGESHAVLNLSLSPVNLFSHDHEDIDKRLQSSVARQKVSASTLSIKQSMQPTKPHIPNPSGGSLLSKGPEDEVKKMDPHSPPLKLLKRKISLSSDSDDWIWESPKRKKLQKNEVREQKETVVPKHQKQEDAKNDGDYTVCFSGCTRNRMWEDGMIMCESGTKCLSEAPLGLFHKICWKMISNNKRLCKFCTS